MVDPDAIRDEKLTQDPEAAEARDKPNRGYGRIGKRLRLAGAAIADRTPSGFDENIDDELDLEGES